MKIKMTQALRGPEVSYAPGDVLDVPEEQARHMVSKGVAVIVRGRPKKAVTREVETR